MRRLGVTALVGMLLVMALSGVVGCGGGGLSASSTCKDFSEASPEEQYEAISSLSSKFNTPAYTTPLGEPEVGYYCASSPETTLEEFFEQAAQSGEAG